MVASALDHHRPALQAKERGGDSSSPLLPSSTSTTSDPPPAYETFGADKQPPTSQRAMKSRKSHQEALLFASFWLFGTVVVMQFGVVVTAANDLVGNSAPPGLILFAYTLPSIIIRMFVPYIKFPDLRRLGGWRSKYTRLSTVTASSIDGEESSSSIDYNVRLSICAVSSLIGLQLLAWCDSIGVRMLGIAMASLSSNLGDMSFFQLATRYPTMITQSMGGYAAGSGAAGLIGSFVYTLFTGASIGASPSSVLSGVGLAPTLMLLVYFFILPPPCKESTAGKPPIINELGLWEKLRLVKPMIWGYMAPLAALMFLENITTQGILPTILYHLPLPGPLSNFFITTRDFYPFFFTTYQSAIFLGRTSINFFRLPGHNRGSSASYWILVSIETICLFSLLSQSLSMSIPVAANEPPDSHVRFPPLVVAGFIFTMGLCGGLGMSGTYWRVSKKRLPEKVWVALDAAICRIQGRQEEDGIWGFDAAAGSSEPLIVRYEPASDAVAGNTAAEEADAPSEPLLGGNEVDAKRWTKEEEIAVREFLIATIALPDVAAIFVASVLSLWVQPRLCGLQVDAGRGLCREAR